MFRMRARRQRSQASMSRFGGVHELRVLHVPGGFRRQGLQGEEFGGRHLDDGPTDHDVQAALGA